MMLLDINLDLLRWFNGLHTDWLDSFFLVITDRRTWYPLYVVLAVWLLWRFRWRGALMLGLVFAMIFLSDRSSTWLKGEIGRVRPCHDEAVAPLLHLLPDTCGSTYGSVSSHAANSFALALFLALALPQTRYRKLKITIWLWAVLNTLSRVYLGVHWPIDVLLGALLGTFCALLAFLLWRILKRFIPVSGDGKQHSGW